MTEIETIETWFQEPRTDKNKVLIQIAPTAEKAKELKFNGNVDRWFVDVQVQFGKKFVIISSKQCVNVIPAE